MGRDNKIEVDWVASGVDWLAIRVDWLAGMHRESGSFKLKSQPITSRGPWSVATYSTYAQYMGAEGQARVN
jgi:hypothetical protein